MGGLSWDDIRKMPRKDLVEKIHAGLKEQKHAALKGEDFRNKKSAFRSGGDMVIPICCFPFCSLAGREHLFNDDEIMQLIDSISAGHDHQEVAKQLRLGEGSRFEDIFQSFSN